MYRTKGVFGLACALLFIIGAPVVQQSFAADSAKIDPGTIIAKRGHGRGGCKRSRRGRHCGRRKRHRHHCHDHYYYYGPGPYAAPYYAYPPPPYYYDPYWYGCDSGLYVNFRL